MKKIKLTDYRRMVCASQTNFTYSKNIAGEFVRGELKVLRRALRRVDWLLNRAEPRSVSWQHELAEALRYLNEAACQYKESVAQYLDTDSDKIARYIVSVVRKRNHELSMDYFVDTGSRKYNKTASLAIVNMIDLGVLGVDLGWKLYLTAEKLPAT